MDSIYSFLGLYKTVAHYTTMVVLELTQSNLNLIIANICSSHLMDIGQCVVQSHSILLLLCFFVLHKLQWLKFSQPSM